MGSDKILFFIIRRFIIMQCHALVVPVCCDWLVVPVCCDWLVVPVRGD